MISIYNKEKTKILTNPDLNKGKLVSDTITTTITAKPEVSEIAHFVVAKTYPNGGKDIEKVIERAFSPAVAEEVITEDIKIYIPFSPQELAEKQALDREYAIINEIRKKYSLEQELALIRQKDTKQTQYQQMCDYIEKCKATFPQV
ncbi:MAG: hypothetical protein RR416_01405 [Clostridia bacterium]